MEIINLLVDPQFDTFNPITYKENIQSLFNFLDDNKNKSLDQKEVANTLILMSQGDKVQKVKAAFRFYDNDKNGYLSLE